MNDIVKDMQEKVGCEYISDLPSYKRKVWQEMKRLNTADYEESDKFESVNNFQTASLHGNKKQTILKVGGGTNGK